MDILEEALKISKYNAKDKDLIHSDRIKELTNDFTVLEDTFNDYKIGGHDDILNPVDRISACVNYIRDRYNSFKDFIEWADCLNETMREFKGTETVLNHEDTKRILESLKN